jgi:hypothetical protein
VGNLYCHEKALVLSDVSNQDQPSLWPLMNKKRLGLKWIELLNSSSLAKPFRSYVESRNLELHPLH